MNSNICAILSATLLFAGASFAQLSPVPPKNFRSAAPIDLMTVSRLELSHNSPAAIRQELLDTNVVAVIAASTGLRKEELAKIRLVPESASGDLWVYQLGESEKAWNAFNKKLGFYVNGRLEGHTAAFLLARLTNHTQAPTVSEPCPPCTKPRAAKSGSFMSRL